MKKIQKNFYQSKKWREMRLKILKRDKYCVFCQMLSTEVDHIKSLKEFPDLALSPANLRGLCKSCHSRRTRKQTDKRPWISSSGVPSDPNHRWNKEDE